jgi:hypothetical protein
MHDEENNERILKSARFAENPRRSLFFSHEERKVFSHEVLRDHDSEWLKRALAEQVPENEYRFYRHTSDLEVCNEILAEMGLASDIIAIEVIG